MMMMIITIIITSSAVTSWACHRARLKLRVAEGSAQDNRDHGLREVSGRETLDENAPPMPVEHAMVPHPAPVEDLAGAPVEELGPQSFGDPEDPA